MGWFDGDVVSTVDVLVFWKTYSVLLDDFFGQILSPENGGSGGEPTNPRDGCQRSKCHFGSSSRSSKVLRFRQYGMWSEKFICRPISDSPRYESE